MHQSENVGYLEMFTGCMYSGKTTKLIDIYNDYLVKGIKTCVVNYIGDDRYHDEMMSSHDKKMIPCHRVKYIYDIFLKNPEILDTIDVYLINEGQFFKDLYEVVKLLVVSHGKTVYVVGLDGDFLMNKFGQISDLIPLCDKYEKLYAKCFKCNNPASFTERKTNDNKQLIIGSSDIYNPVCRNCRVIRS
jgi:thymidine kinase